MSKQLFDAIRTIKGSALTQADVDLINGALAAGSEPEAPSVPEVDPELIAQLKIDEGCRLKAYKDTVGVWTIGYGHTGPEVQKGLVWTQEKAEAVLIADVRKHNAELLRRAPWISGLDPVRQRVLFNMAFNLGINGLLGFKNTLAYVQAGKYDFAADGMLKSKWAGQVGDRAVRLAKLMRGG